MYTNCLLPDPQVNTKTACPMGSNENGLARLESASPRTPENTRPAVRPVLFVATFVALRSWEAWEPTSGMLAFRK